MAIEGLHNAPIKYNMPNVPPEAGQKNSNQQNVKIAIQEEKKLEPSKEKISMEELTRTLMKPKEIKRLLYLAIPFTRHLVAELENKKGIILDKQG